MKNCSIFFDQSITCLQLCQTSPFWRNDEIIKNSCNASFIFNRTHPAVFFNTFMLEWRFMFVNIILHKFHYACFYYLWSIYFQINGTNISNIRCLRLFTLSLKYKAYLICIKKLTNMKSDSTLSARLSRALRVGLHCSSFKPYWLNIG